MKRVRFPPFKSWAIALSLLAISPVVSWSQPGNINIPGGGLRCTNAGYCSVFSSSLPDVFGGAPDPTNQAIGWYLGVAAPYDEWCIINNTMPYHDIFIPTGTFTEFQSFITIATNPDPAINIPGVTVAPCCDTSRCGLHNGDCAACAAEGLLGPGNCCDWTCATPNAVTNINGNACCQISYVPPGPLDPGLLRGGQCTDSCGDNVCQAWENNSNCCLDCNVIGDGFCCAADGENINTACMDCPGGFACPNGVCCGHPLAGEDRTNCADCAVCNDDYCTAPPETSLNCCRDCAVGPAFCGNEHCCPFHENTVNCCTDCGCGVPGFSCVIDGNCHRDCDALPYVHEPGPHQCTIAAVSLHGDTPAGSCAITGTCSAQCQEGGMINWVNNCCTNWVDSNVCGPANGCPLNQSWHTRTCSSISTQNLGQCFNNPACCTAWSNVGCWTGGCARGQMRQTRQCGGNTEFRCVDDAVNCCSCDSWSTPGCGFDCNGDSQHWTRNCYPDACQDEDDGCQFYCGCAGTCCDNDGNCEYAEDNGVCCDCAVCGGCGCQASKGENCSNSCGDCACPGSQVCNSGVCELPSCGALGGTACCSTGCALGQSELGASSDCTQCCTGTSCYPNPASASGSISCEAHGGYGPGPSGSRTCSNNWFPLGGGWSNYQLNWSVYGHRHGTSDFNYRMCLSGSCQDGGNWTGGCLGFEYGNCAGQSHPANLNFNSPCQGSCVSGGSITVGPAIPAVFGRIYVDDAHAWIDWTVNAW